MLALVNRAPTKTAYTLEVRIYSIHVHVGSMLHPLLRENRHTSNRQGRGAYSSTGILTSTVSYSM
jgi:hypothetical protein